MYIHRFVCEIDLYNLINWGCHKSTASSLSVCVRVNFFLFYFFSPSFFASYFYYFLLIFRSHHIINHNHAHVIIIFIFFRIKNYKNKN